MGFQYKNPNISNKVHHSNFYKPSVPFKGINFPKHNSLKSNLQTFIFKLRYYKQTSTKICYDLLSISSIQ